MRIRRDATKICNIRRTFKASARSASNDYRSWIPWLNLCDTPDEVNSVLKVYDGGDHFFMHDSRFVEDVLKDIHDFAVAN